MQLGSNLPHVNIICFIRKYVCGEARIEHIYAFCNLQETIGWSPVEESAKQRHTPMHESITGAMMISSRSSTLSEPSHSMNTFTNLRTKLPRLITVQIREQTGLNGAINLIVIECVQSIKRMSRKTSRSQEVYSIHRRRTEIPIIRELFQKLQCNRCGTLQK